MVQTSPRSSPINIRRRTKSQIEEGLKNGMLVRNIHNKIVYKNKSLNGKNTAWIDAVARAKSDLNLEGFHLIKKNTKLYDLAREYLDDMKS